MKNDGYQSDKSKETLKRKQNHLIEIQQQLKQLESDIERYTQLSKEGKASTSNTTTTTSKQSDLAVVKERIKSQKQVYERLDKQLSDSERQKLK